MTVINFKKTAVLQSGDSASEQKMSSNSPSNKWGFYTLAILVWISCVLPSTLLFMTHERQWGETISYTPATQAVRNALILIVVAYSIMLIFRYGTNLSNRPFGIIFLSILTTLYPAITESFHLAEFSPQFVPGLVSVIILLAIFSLRFDYHNLKILGILGAMTGLLSLFMALVRPTSAFVLQGGGRILAGPFNNSNYLGISLALLLPFSFLLRKHLARIICITLILWPTLIGGSDTAIIAVGVMLTVWLVTQILKHSQIRGAILSTVAAITLAICLVFPYLINDPTSFTGRGIIWMIAQRDFPNFLLFGAGNGWFAEISHEAGYLVHNAHNIFLQPLIVGGLAAFILVIYIVLSLIRFGLREITRGKMAPFLFIEGMLVLGMLGDYFLLDARDLRYFASGFVIISLLALATSPLMKVDSSRT